MAKAKAKAGGRERDQASRYSQDEKVKQRLLLHFPERQAADITNVFGGTCLLEEVARHKGNDAISARS